ncbi:MULTISPECIES: TRAP transporter small permease [unclassified Lentilitoribacter]|uniref:TRAP transporter small permease n=1 Tax=unclassified Lentilitoribacter TaxID=2647570 RepID=UPI0018D8B750|nr:TRAP transporter small permease subunit [Lentilitoribacter sp. Alg239-R112]
MNILTKILIKTIELWAILGGILLMGAVFVTVLNVMGFTANVLVRPFGGYVSGLSGFEDMVTLWVGVVALSFMPYCQLKHGHIAVDVFMKSAPAWLQNTMHFISNLLMVAVAIFLGVMLYHGMVEARGDGTVTAVLGWPVWGFMLPGIMSSALWTIAALMTMRELPTKTNGARTHGA